MMETSSDSDKTNDDPSEIVPDAKISFYAEEHTSAVEDDAPSSEDTVIVSETSSDHTRTVSDVSSTTHSEVASIPQSASFEEKSYIENVDESSTVDDSETTDPHTNTDLQKLNMADVEQTAVDVVELSKQQNSPIIQKDSENCTNENKDLETISDIEQPSVNIVEVSTPPQSPIQKDSENISHDNKYLEDISDAEEPPVDILEVSTSPKLPIQNDSEHCAYENKDLENITDAEQLPVDIEVPTPPKSSVQQGLGTCVHKCKHFDNEIEHDILNCSANNCNCLHRRNLQNNNERRHSSDDDSIKQEYNIHNLVRSVLNMDQIIPSMVKTALNMDQSIPNMVKNAPNMDENITGIVASTSNVLNKEQSNHVVISSDDDSTQSNVIEVISSDDEVEEVVMKNDKQKCNHLPDKNNVVSKPTSTKFDRNDSLDKYLGEGCRQYSDASDDGISVPSISEFFEYDPPGFIDTVGIADNMIQNLSKRKEGLCTNYTDMSQYNVSNFSTDENTKVCKHRNLLNDDNNHGNYKTYLSDNGNHVSFLKDKMNKGCISVNPIDLDKYDDVTEPLKLPVITAIRSDDKGSPNKNNNDNNNESHDSNIEILIELMEHNQSSDTNETSPENVTKTTCTSNLERENISRNNETIENEDSRTSEEFENINLLIDLIDKGKDVSSEEPTSSSSTLDDTRSEKSSCVNCNINRKETEGNNYSDHSENKLPSHVDKRNTNRTCDSSEEKNSSSVTETSHLDSVKKIDSYTFQNNVIGPQAYPEKTIIESNITTQNLDKITSDNNDNENEGYISKKRKKRKKNKRDSRSMVSCVDTFNELQSLAKKSCSVNILEKNNVNFLDKSNENQGKSVLSEGQNNVNETDISSVGYINKSQQLVQQQQQQQINLDKNVSEVIDVSKESGTYEAKQKVGEDIEANQTYEISSTQIPEYTSIQHPQQVGASFREFQSKPENHLRGCLWSPDGSCILTNSDDNILRVFKIPDDLLDNTLTDELCAELKMSEGETVYDMNWYPYMDAQNPDTCCFLSTSRDHPIHLWDSYNGVLRCSYRAFNQMDELTSAQCVAFNIDGSKIYCGFDKCIRIFESSRPGSECTERCTVAKKNGSRKGKPKYTQSQPGIISSIAFSAYCGLYALGSFSRTVGLYDVNDGKTNCVLNGHTGGVTQVKFTNDGYYLISGARKDCEIIWWDLRNTSLPLFKLLRNVSTNQRIQFDIDKGNLNVFSGSTDKMVNIWDLKQLPDEIQDDVVSYEPTYQFCAHNDAVNAVCLHPTKPLLATTSGQRHFFEDSDSDSTGTDSSASHFDNSLKLWKL